MHSLAKKYLILQNGIKGMKKYAIINSEETIWRNKKAPRNESGAFSLGVLPLVKGSQGVLKHLGNQDRNRRDKLISYKDPPMIILCA